MSLYFELGKTVSSGLEKQARIGRAGIFAARSVDALSKLLGPLARGGGKAIGGGLKSDALRAPTLGALGLGGLAGNELLGAAAERTGLPIPHLFGNKDTPLWSPHRTANLIDPKQKGFFGALGHMLSRPIQSAQSIMGYGPEQSRYSALKNWDPRSKRLSIDPTSAESKKIKFDRQGNWIFPESMYLPEILDKKRSLQQGAAELHSLGLESGLVPGRSRSYGDYNVPSALQPRGLTVSDLPY